MSHQECPPAGQGRQAQSNIHGVVDLRHHLFTRHGDDVRKPAMGGAARWRAACAAWRQASARDGRR